MLMRCFVSLFFSSFSFFLLFLCIIPLCISGEHNFGAKQRCAPERLGMLLCSTSWSLFFFIFHFLFLSSFLLFFFPSLPITWDRNFQEELEDGQVKEPKRKERTAGLSVYYDGSFYFLFFFFFFFFLFALVLFSFSHSILFSCISSSFSSFWISFLFSFLFLTQATGWKI